MVANDDVWPNVGVVAVLPILTDNGRTNNHHTVLQDRALADGNVLADVGGALAAVAQFQTRAGGQVGGDLSQRLPGVFASVEDSGVPGLGQIKQFTRLEHLARRYAEEHWLQSLKTQRCLKWRQRTPKVRIGVTLTGEPRGAVQTGNAKRTARGSRCAVKIVVLNALARSS